MSNREDQTRRATDFAKTLEYLKDNETGEFKPDADWSKFKDFLQREATLEDNDSGQGELSHLPPQLAGSNWGAGILTVVWGVAMQVKGGQLLLWFILLMLPVIGLIFPLYLLLKGNEIAWKNRRWASYEEFRTVQKKWTLIGFALAGVLAIIFVLFSVWIYSMVGSLLRV